MYSMRIDAAAMLRSLRQVEADSLATVRQGLGQAAEHARQLAKASPSFKDRTGRLRASIVRGQRSTWVHFVKAGSRRAPYALFVEEDTKAHIIRARRVQFLRFVVAGGGVRFARAVNHPGTTGKHFMRDARNRVELPLYRFIEAGLNRAHAG